MGVSTIGAVGVALPPPQALYPNTIGNQPGGAVGTNRMTLPPGGDFDLPSGTWLVSMGTYSQLQVLDPVTNTWFPYSAQTVNEPISVNSDGSNYRLINPTGFPIGAVITNGGTGYTSAPTVAAGIGASTWISLVGGALSAINISTAGSGLGYATPPLVNIAAPPTPGIQATAVAAISGGIITGFTITNPGAGYASAPAVVIVPQASDLNYFPQSGVTPPTTKNAVATAQLSYVGVVTAVLMTNEGNNTLTAAPALSFTGGGGSNAAATAIMAFTVTGVTVTTGGSGYSFPGTGITTVGGSLLGTTSGTGAATNSAALSTSLLVPRQAQITATAGSGTGVQVGVIVDGGLFETVPVAIAIPGASGTAATQSVFAVTVGGVNDTVFATPL